MDDRPHVRSQDFLATVKTQARICLSLDSCSLFGWESLAALNSQVYCLLSLRALQEVFFQGLLTKALDPLQCAAVLTSYALAQAIRGWWWLIRAFPLDHSVWLRSLLRQRVRAWVAVGLYLSYVYKGNTEKLHYSRQICRRAAQPSVDPVVPGHDVRLARAQARSGQVLGLREFFQNVLQVQASWQTLHLANLGLQ